MKWMIASDIHGSAPNCAAMLERFRVEGAERLILLGDLLYHGPRNDLPEGYDPKAVIALLSEARDRLLCVRGNCDAEVDQMVLPFPILSDTLLLCEDGLTVLATHGHLFNEEQLPPLQKGDVLLHGHTHIPVLENRGDYWLLNPGSVSIPKEGSARGYLTLENGCFTHKSLTGRELARLSIESRI
ncbi:MAG: phosphodiesterase [Provencibacterium sp.]|nr:phosphodiesterase [Provencibacterium sp.]